MAAAYVHKAAWLRAIGALIVVIASTGCAAVGDDSAGDEPAVPITPGALVPDVGTVLVGDQLHAYGWIGPSPPEDSRPHAVVDCLREDLALAYAFAVERVDRG